MFAPEARQIRALCARGVSAAALPTWPVSSTQRDMSATNDERRGRGTESTTDTAQPDSDATTVLSALLRVRRTFDDRERRRETLACNEATRRQRTA